MVSESEVVIATFGGSVALAGLALVLLGFLSSSFSTAAGPGSDEAKKKLKETAYMGFYTLVLAVFSVSASLAWLLGEDYIEVPISMFSIALASILTTGAEVISKTMDIDIADLWRDVRRRVSRQTDQSL